MTIRRTDGPSGRILRPIDVTAESEVAKNLPQWPPPFEGSVEPLRPTSALGLDKTAAQVLGALDTSIDLLRAYRESGDEKVLEALRPKLSWLENPPGREAMGATLSACAPQVASALQDRLQELYALRKLMQDVLPKVGKIAVQLETAVQSALGEHVETLRKAAQDKEAGGDLIGALTDVRSAWAAMGALADEHETERLVSETKNVTPVKSPSAAMEAFIEAGRRALPESTIVALDKAIAATEPGNIDTTEVDDPELISSLVAREAEGWLDTPDGEDVVDAMRRLRAAMHARHTDFDPVPTAESFVIDASAKAACGQTSLQATLREASACIGPTIVTGFDRLVAEDVRAGWIADSRTIDVGTSGAPETVVLHEIGHAFEAADPARLAASKAWLAKRSKPEIKPMRTLEGDDSYREDESGFEDHFFVPYVGKIYDDGAATEVVAMGFERLLASPESAAQFLAEDREHFFLVLGMLMTC